MLWEIREVRQVVTDYLVTADSEEDAWNKYYSNEDAEVKSEESEVVHNDIHLINHD